jgi:hypothetical protein
MTGIRSRAVPGDALLHPLALAALALLLVNDHLLKGVAPSPLTGILSGVAGMVVMPLVLVALVEVASAAAGRWRGPGTLALVAACLVTAVGYAAVELVPAAADAYRFGWGALQWPGSALAALADGRALPAIVPVSAVSDPFDLLALAALAVPLLIGRARLGTGPRRQLGATPA